MSNDNRIFISYRRSDSEHIVERIYNELCRVYGSKSVFKDTYSIPLGSNFPDYISSTLSEAKVFVLVIGKTFLASHVDGRSRLFEENDYLRIEIETALKLGLVIIPVLDKDVPYPLAKDLPDSLQKIVVANSLQLAGPVYFKVDMDNLINAINKVLKTNPVSVAKRPKKMKMVLLSLLLIGILICGFVFYKKSDTGGDKKDLPPLTVKFIIRGISPGNNIPNYNIVTVSQDRKQDSLAVLREGDHYYSLISNVNNNMKGMRFDVHLNDVFGTEYMIALNNPGKQYVFADTTYDLLVEPVNRQTAAPAVGDDTIKEKKDQTKDNVVSDESASGNRASTIDCNISGIVFLDNETFTDNLIFTESTKKNHFSFHGKIGSVDGVSGKAVLNQKQLTLTGDCIGELTFMDCKTLSGSLRRKGYERKVEYTFKSK